MYIANIVHLMPSNINPSVSYTSFDLSHMGIFFGVGGFAYEAAGTVFTSRLEFTPVRTTMQQPKKMAPLIMYTFAFIGFIFVMFSLSFYFVYGNENMEEVIFNVYDKDSNMFLLAIVFCCVLVIFVPLYNISNTELLEKIPWISNLVADESGDKTRLTVVAFRLITFAFFSGLALLTNEVTVVLNLAGGIAIPLVSFYLPVHSTLTLVLLEFPLRQGSQEAPGAIHESARRHTDCPQFWHPVRHSEIYHHCAIARRS